MKGKQVKQVAVVTFPNSGMIRVFSSKKAAIAQMNAEHGAKLVCDKIGDCCFDYYENAADKKAMENRVCSINVETIEA